MYKALFALLYIFCNIYNLEKYNKYYKVRRSCAQEKGTDLYSHRVTWLMRIGFINRIYKSFTCIIQTVNVHSYSTINIHLCTMTR
ncbi:hypothetical protein GDO81_030020 [Engystomops pustulosus]|uniref:Secreted protein n=1 Tax=Engystomops pustulosus TaxID=76066 RepID=A0AAV6Z3S4_ENGPU|nr:hypothetical protein GDO81_030020 [Engystomops pustulosus]